MFIDVQTFRRARALEMFGPIIRGVVVSIGVCLLVWQAKGGNVNRQVRVVVRVSVMISRSRSEWGHGETQGRGKIEVTCGVGSEPRVRADIRVKVRVPGLSGNQGPGGCRVCGEGAPRRTWSCARVGSARCMPNDCIIMCSL